MINQKIVHLAKFFPPHKGGIEKITSIFASNNENSKITIIAFSNKFTPNIRKRNLNVIICKTLFESYSQPFSFNYIYQGIKGLLKSDIVHVHAPNILAFMVLLLPFRRKIIVHWHSDIIHYHNFRFIIKPIENLILNKAAKIVCATQNYYESSKILSKYKNKISLIPYGIKKNQNTQNIISNKIKVLVKELRQKKIIISVGRLIEYKGFDKLVEVGNFLSEDCIILIVGNGPLENSLSQKIIKNKLQKKVKILNNISNEDLAFLLKNSNLYCCFSINRQESFGISLIEALMHKLPIYSEEIVGSGVNYVNPNGITGINTKSIDAQRTAIKINKLLSNKEKMKVMSNNAYARYKKLFTEERMLLSFNNLYKDILKN
ncbi:MAG: glycosyltransferase [Methylophilaceae bacterium]|nr:glycosyltransferase [Methylophilaceae bacterium]